MSLTELFNLSNNHSQYIGTGNPNSKILFVGKEAGIKSTETSIPGSATSWNAEVNSYLYTRYTPPKSIPEHRNGNHTWQKYQKLFERISNQINIENSKPKDLYEITFIEYIFTTELSNLHANSSKLALKNADFNSNLAERKKIFWKSNFIQNFDIVVIFASDRRYIEKWKGEVQSLFDVVYDDEIQIKSEKGSVQKIWVHYSNPNDNRHPPKLVLHTRQLTNGCLNILIDKVADLITEHVKKYNIPIISAVNT